MGRTKTVTLGVAPAEDGYTVGSWTASASSGGLAVSPAAGSFKVGNSSPGTAGGGLAGCTGLMRQTQALTIGATAPGSYVVDIDLRATDGTALPPVVLAVHVTA